VCSSDLAWSLDNLHSQCFSETHPNANVELDRRIVEVGEYRFNVEQRHKGWSWISAHWLRFGGLAAKRFAFFWFPATAGGKGLALMAAMIVSLLTLASIPGLILMHRENRFAAYMLAACLVFFPLVYYVVNVDVRYRYPVLWVSCMATAYLLTRPRRGISLS